MAVRRRAAGYDCGRKEIAGYDGAAIVNYICMVGYIFICGVNRQPTGSNYIKYRSVFLRCWLFAGRFVFQVTVFHKTVTCFLSHQSKSQHRQILTEKIVTKLRKCWLFESCLAKKPTPEKYAEIACDLALCLVTSLPHCSQHRRNVVYFSANCKNIQHYARTA